MGEKIARFKPGDNVSVKPNGPLAGDQLKCGRFVTVAKKDEKGNYLADHSAAGEAHPFGVTQRDSAKPNVEDTNSVDLLVECVRTGSIPFVEAGEVIDADPTVEVAVGEDGKAVKAEGEDVAVGRALTSAAEAGDFIEVDLY
jgi:phage terminase large subunit-like protein